MTPLAALIARLIEAEGPMPLDRFMAFCLCHPEHGYYMGRDPFGARGDFITAPEVSQVFGELIGVWCAAQWQVMGGPGQLILAELGPGRGTLMADLLRAAGKAAGFASAAEVHLVEISPALRRLQDEKLGPGVQWHQDMASLPEDAPLLVIANEFFDAIPIRQFVRRAGRWHERLIGLEKGSLALGLAPVPTPLMAEGVEGGVLEIAPQREAIAEVLAKRLVNQGGALLAIDYGHFKPATGDTLQAMQAHSFVPIVHQPGLADITSHVDFDALAQAFERGGAVVPPAMTQGAFLTAMGLGPRVEALTRRLSGHERDAVLTGAGRLAEDGQMGHLFKVICAHGPQTPTPYPFGQT